LAQTKEASPTQDMEAEESTFRRVGANGWINSQVV
jgi:hypothetical protein